MECMTAGSGDVLRRLLTEPTISVDDAARVLGIGRSTVYAAVKAGEVPVIRVRSRLRVPSRWVRQRLHLEGEPDAGDSSGHLQQISDDVRSEWR
jgi:excisionase family DNA binding protein